MNRRSFMKNVSVGTFGLVFSASNVVGKTKTHKPLSFVDPPDYGGTDASTAINEAISDMDNPITLKDGNYLIKNPILLDLGNSKVELAGESRHGVVLKSDVGSWNHVIHDGWGSVDCEIRNLTIDLTGDDENAVGLGIEGEPKRFVVDSVDFKASTLRTQYLLNMKSSSRTETETDITIKNSLFDYRLPKVGSAIITRGYRGVDFIHNKFLGASGKSGVCPDAVQLTDQPSLKDVRFILNTFKNFGHNAVITKRTEGVKFLWNDFFLPTDFAGIDCIDPNSCEGMLIHGNNFYNPSQKIRGKAVSIEHGCRNFRINLNQLEEARIDIEDSSNIILSDNIFECGVSPIDKYSNNTDVRFHNNIGLDDM